MNSKFDCINSREYWTTKDGRKLFPNEFEDEHLANTVIYLEDRAKNYRLEKAMYECMVVNGKVEENISALDYYSYFKRQMDCFIDRNVSDTEWLKNNSKIYTMLLDEVKFRSIDMDEARMKKEREKYSFRNTFTASKNRRTSTSDNIWATYTLGV